MQKYEQGQQEARNAEHYLQDNLKNFHEQPFRGTAATLEFAAI